MEKNSKTVWLRIYEWLESNGRDIRATRAISTPRNLTVWHFVRLQCLPYS